MDTILSLLSLLALSLPVLILVALLWQREIEIWQRRRQEKRWQEHYEHMKQYYLDHPDEWHKDKHRIRPGG